MKKILIFGSKGNLGTQLVKTFNKDYKIFALDKEDIDITEKKIVFKKVDEIKPDIIINATAYNAVDKCEENEMEFKLAKKINGNAVGYLAEAAIKFGVILIHYSTDYVFDGKKKSGYKENNKQHPINKYGKTKLIGEQEIIKRSKQGLKYYLIRTSKLFGQKGKSEITKLSFFDLILNLSKEKKEFNMIDKEEISCFTYILDLAEMTKKLIENNANYGIYHIINSEPCSWYEASKFLFKLKNITDAKLNPINSSDYPRPAKRPKYSILLNTKLLQMRSWKKALREYLIITQNSNVKTQNLS
ncbi:MAG: dTDP-4-dehydrorhamnose reductase [Candidatus Kuenenbacteria bacterium]